MVAVEFNPSPSNRTRRSIRIITTVIRIITTVIRIVPDRDCPAAGGRGRRGTLAKVCGQ